MFGVIPEMTACPQCGMPAVRNNYHVSGEEEITCNYCGFQRQKTLSGKMAQKGYGCIHYVKKDEKNGSVETIIRLNTPLSLLGRHEIIMDIEKNYDKDNSSFYVWSEERGIEAIIGAKPMTVEQYAEEQRKEAEYHMRSMRACCSEDFL